MLEPKEPNARTRSALRPLPDLLSGGRFVLGPLFALSLDDAPIVPLGVACVASVSDFLDGRLSRALGTSSARGAALDVAADAFFLLCALGALAASGRISFASPIAAAVALAALAWAWRSGARQANLPRGPADRVGHAAGILNFALVLLASGAPLLPRSGTWLVPASLAVAAVNLAPLVLRRVRA